MSVDLYGEAPPNAQAFILAHLLSLTDDPESLGAKRWITGMPLPYRIVQVFMGPADLITSMCKVRLHTLDRTYTACSHEADRGHSRMLVLVEDPLYDVTIGSAVANCESMTVNQSPHEEPYAAESVVTRFISEYDLALRFTR